MSLLTEIGELLRLRKDAERYEWWTKNYGCTYDGAGTFRLYTLVGTADVDTKAKFDAAIDAAMRSTISPAKVD